ncbi:MAG TPA: hypothetical protein VIV60_20345 [Polyangiaceae bacterium]
MSQRQWGLLLEHKGDLLPALEHLVEATCDAQALELRREMHDALGIAQK